ncbi:hypothetical protein [Mesorhizobium captivum]|uniref:hypothetical protein n=1 Tax=Mesorhizobium captivum TaxID=3072319 RepID=UPI002A24E6B6|nr:hypothetical protein [Mesorhizobium sp. VK23E]MDX8515056.1 hypothetical protein [Mesorhizobium sp. VK23E]
MGRFTSHAIFFAGQVCALFWKVSDVGFACSAGCASGQQRLGIEAPDAAARPSEIGGLVEAPVMLDRHINRCGLKASGRAYQCGQQVEIATKRVERDCAFDGQLTPKLVGLACKAKIRWEGRARSTKASPPIGRRKGSGLLRNDLVVVTVMMVAVVVPVMMLAVMVMMLLHRSRIGAGRAEDRHRERQGQSQPERGQEGLLHDFVSFLRGRSEIHRTKSVTQASRSGLSSWFFSTIFPNCRFLFLDCFLLNSDGAAHPKGRAAGVAAP